MIVDKSTLSPELPTFLGLCTAICRGRDVNQDLLSQHETGPAATWLDCPFAKNFFFIFMEFAKLSF